jgi:predicted lipid-binding transport protein (Tim44 family)
MGNGFGAGAAGMMSLLFQLGLAALVVAVVVKLLQRRRQPAAAGGAPLDWAAAAARRDAPSAGFERQAPAYPASATPTVEAVDVTAADKDAFERLLIEIQDAFAREDYSALRARTTPEIMSYLAEELSENATSGRRNDVSDTQLLEADIAESWREDDLDYATAALRYQNVDIMRDRQSGAVLSGDPGRATQTTELWTFVRRRGEDWKLSAIQEA